MFNNVNFTNPSLSLQAPLTQPGVNVKAGDFLLAVNGRDQFRFSFVGDASRRALTEAEVRTAIVKAVGRFFRQVEKAERD